MRISRNEFARDAIYLSRALAAIIPSPTDNENENNESDASTALLIQWKVENVTIGGQDVLYLTHPPVVCNVNECCLNNYENDYINGVDEMILMYPLSIHHRQYLKQHGLLVLCTVKPGWFQFCTLQ